MIMAALGSRDPPRPPDPPSAGAGSRAGVTSIIINITLLTSINTTSGHQTRISIIQMYLQLSGIVVAGGCRHYRQAAVITLHFLLDICPARLLCSLCTVRRIQCRCCCGAYKLSRYLQTIYISTNYLDFYKLSTYLQTI